VTTQQRHVTIPIKINIKI